jgi:uncharacterized membrane protein YgcG
VLVFIGTASGIPTEEQMLLGTRIALAASMVSVVAFSLAPSVSAQEPRVGVVTNVEGMATVARVALAEPQQLRFKDDVFVKDRITTGDRAIVRVLLGGKATVTARERSILTITEAPGISTVELTSGRIAVAVSKAKMQPGEIVEIRTPNAVTAVRGTVVIAEVWPDTTLRSTITVLRGLVDVTRLDALTRLPVGTAVDVAVHQTLTVVGVAPLPRPRSISVDEANRLTAEFRMSPSSTPSANAAPAIETAVRHAARDAEGIGPSSGNNGHRNANGSGNSSAAGNSSNSGSSGGSGRGTSVNVAVISPAPILPAVNVSVTVGSRYKK